MDHTWVEHITVLYDMAKFLALHKTIRLMSKLLHWQISQLIILHYQLPLKHLYLYIAQHKARRYKTFLSVIYEFLSLAWVFVPVKPFQPSPMFVGKAKTYPSEVPL